VLGEKFKRGGVMKKTLKFLLLISIAALLAGCKLAIIVVEGGEVKSEASGTCVSGSVCILEVNDTNFREAFRAVPDSGWYFHKWHSGDRFFCGGEPDPECELAPKYQIPGLEEDADLKALVDQLFASSETFFLMPVFKQTPPMIIVPDDRPVRIDGKEWLQPIHFVNYSYGQINEACPDGICTGNLPGSNVDLTGYFWASRKDVRSLFDFYKESGRNILDDFIYTLAEKDGELDQAVNLNLRVILSDEPTSEGWVYGAGVYDGQPFEPSKEERGIGASPFISESSSGSDQGAWFWRML
jgi:hypothetical protein